MKTIQGIVKAKSDKTNGLLIEGQENWFNATEVTKKYVKNINKGDEVALEVDEEGKINFIKAIEPSKIHSDSIKKQEGLNPYNQKTKEIRRMSALKTATEIVTTVLEKKKEVPEIDTIAKELVIPIAETLEKWIIG